MKNSELRQALIDMNLDIKDLINLESSIKETIQEYVKSKNSSNES